MSQELPNQQQKNPNQQEFPSRIDRELLKLMQQRDAAVRDFQAAKAKGINIDAKDRVMSSYTFIINGLRSTQKCMVGKATSAKSSGSF